MADVSAPPVVDVRVVLPDHWWVIPLQPLEARTRSVERLVERQFAGVDNQPLLRADTRRQLLAQAETAADSHGRPMALSLQRVGDVPVPASLVLHWIDVPAAPESSARLCRFAPAGPPGSVRAGRAGTTAAGLRP